MGDLLPLQDIPNTIELKDLRRWANMFFDILERDGHYRIPLKQSYYWSVANPERIYSDPTQEPEWSGLDDLYDNVRDVMMCENSDADERIICNMKDFAALLHYISSGLPFREPTDA
ncbi:hypothetical protein [Jannaschia pohangensis]|uniref:Uncharacterized protein n=1 Tax=Jannaschia pohangensis TaxID=390807 RepID=A0A1I3P0J5_9RHOB|nr:hypothetical protein [Jannaschia pohangensis]SFJ14971.1 hypothetical protein SAMN04488095_2306 [Jannaschia pohangensis]